MFSRSLLLAAFKTAKPILNQGKVVQNWRHCFTTLKLTRRASRVMDHSRRTAMTGPGSRAEQNKAPSGMSIASVKKHYSLIPLFVIMGWAMAVVVAYLGRLAFHRDTNWFKRQEPWNYYSDKRAKVFQVADIQPRVRQGEYDNHVTKAPNYKD